MSTQFLTLTYRPEAQPLCKDPETGEMLGTIVKSHVQDYIKSLRQRLSAIPWFIPLNAPQVRYFAVGEYGTLSERPHYHIVLFGLDERYQETIRSTWKAGFSSIRPADRASLAYTLKYTMKDQGDPTNPWLRGRAPTFSLMSKRPALGTTFLIQVAKSIKRVACDSKGNPLTTFPTSVEIDGERYPLDRTMLKRLKSLLALSEKQLLDAYPPKIFISRSEHDQTQATGAHHKARRNRNQTTGCPV